MRKMTFSDKMDLFFVDYDLIPLLVQENYLTLGANCTTTAQFRKVAEAAGSIARSDIISNQIRGNQEWSLLPNYALTSTILPSELMSGFIHYPKFPEWLGRNSSSRKVYRETRELRVAMAGKTSGTRYAIKFEYAEALLSLFTHHLTENKDEYGHIEPPNVQSAIELLEAYNLTKEMACEHLVSIVFKRKGEDPLKGVQTSTKSSLTRAYNQRHTDSVKGTTVKGKGDQLKPEVTTLGSITSTHYFT